MTHRFKKLLLLGIILSACILFFGCTSISSKTPSSLATETSPGLSAPSAAVDHTSSSHITGSSSGVLAANENTFTQIRNQIPYEGLRIRPIADYIIDMDETAKKITDYLSVLNLSGNDFNSVSELSEEQIIFSVTMATKYYDVLDNSPASKILKPLRDAASQEIQYPDDRIYLKEHMEQTARLLYGKDVVFHYKNGGLLQYAENLGIYMLTPKGYTTNKTYVIEYEDLGDGYRVEAAILQLDYGAYIDIDSDRAFPEQPPYDEMADFILNKSQRREIIIDKDGEGNLNIKSCHKLSD